MKINNIGLITHILSPNDFFVDKRLKYENHT